MKIIVDGMLSGTGIRDAEKGGYIPTDDLGISKDLRNKISEWLDKYNKAHFKEYENASEVEILDDEGIEICRILATECPSLKIEYYFSDAKMERIDIT